MDIVCIDVIFVGQLCSILVSSPAHFRPPFLIGAGGGLVFIVEILGTPARWRAGQSDYRNVNTSAVIVLQLLPRHGYTETRVALDLVSDAIKHVCLDLGYAAATSDQEKVIKEFLHRKDVFVSVPTVEGKSLC